MKKQLRAVSAVLIALALGACGAEEEAPEDPFTALDDSVVALLDGNYTFKHATTYQVVDARSWPTRSRCGSRWTRGSTGSSSRPTS